MIRVPKTQKALTALIEAAREGAYIRGKRDGIEEGKKIAHSNAIAQQQETRRAALEQATKLASTFGQLMDTLTMAMRSEAGQL